MESLCIGHALNKFGGHHSPVSLCGSSSDLYLGGSHNLLLKHLFFVSLRFFGLGLVNVSLFLVFPLRSPFKFKEERFSSLAGLTLGPFKMQALGRLLPCK